MFYAIENPVKHLESDLTYRKNPMLNKHYNLDCTPFISFKRKVFPVYKYFI